jgi:iron-sulfur cluster assembly enzyme ISCU, mitochondrial
MSVNQLSRSIYSKLRPILTIGVDTHQIIIRDYHEKVIDHYENPRNVGSFDKSDVNVGTGLVGAPACGDVMKLQVESSYLSRIAIISSSYVIFSCD